jgi:hypothetical protein
VSDDGVCRRRVTGVDVAFPYAVYTSVQMLEKHPKTCHFVPLLGAQVVTTGARIRSASRSVRSRSHLKRVFLGTQLTSWHEKPPKALPHLRLVVHYLRLLTMAPDPHELALRRTLPCGRGSDSAHNGARPARVDVTRTHPIPEPQVACPYVDVTVPGPTAS